jgi:hypothetical protein
VITLVVIASWVGPGVFGLLGGPRRVLMYRVLVIATLLAAGGSSPRLEGQMRGSPRPSVPARMSVGPRVSFVRPAPGFGVIRGPLPQFGRGASPVGRRPFRHQLHFHTFFGNSWFGEQEELPFEELAESPSEERTEELTEELTRGTVFLPYSVYAAPYYAEPYYQVAEQTHATVADREGDLFREVERLRDEVGRLREEQVSREQAREAALQPRPPVEAKTPTTILVFRDGRRSEIQNYAIVGRTLWVFTERRALKMPVTDLDLDATKNANDDRGVEFRLP